MVHTLKIQNIVLLLVMTGSQAWANIQPPTKYYDADLTRPDVSRTRFSEADTQTGSFVLRKATEWRSCRRSVAMTPLASNAQDSLRTFLQREDFLTKLQEMQDSELQSGRAEKEPWSGDYWAIAKGILGARYLDPEFVNLDEWKDRYKYIQNNTVQKILKTQGQEGIPLLSPSEKYDLIIGDSTHSLTQSMWLEGKEYQDRYGKVEHWMGICHGWAPAAIVDSRPSKTVEVPSYNGEWKIRLTPSDIKGISSYNWANNRYDAVTIGNRCNKKNPERDENGRPKDPECWDINPATWHIAIVNKLGRDRKSFVMDATYDYEVWNQPVLSYSYTYFNPITQKESSLKDSIVSRTAFKKDPYKKFRSPETTSIVGITMKVAYVLETVADNDPTDSEDKDAVRWVAYEYDLELNSQGKIIGGEWHQIIHPDFIWIPREGFRPSSPLDNALANERWDDGAVPEKWATAARYGAKYGIMLNTLANALNEKSSGVESRP